MLHEWWYLEDFPVLSQHMAASKFAKLSTEDHSIPKAAAGVERECILIACIAPLDFTHPLLNAPYMSPAAGYTLISVRTAAWNWDAPLAPRMRCLRSSLYQMCSGVKSLSNLDMANYITVGRQNLQRQLVHRISSGPVTPAPTYIFHQAKQFSQAAPTKKKIPADRWYLQALSMYSHTDVQVPEELPEIWQTLAPLTKEKARPVLKIACRESARALRCKSPQCTHAVSVFLLGLHFFTEDPYCVNDTVNIFQFPDLSLSARSKESMITRI